MRAGLVDLFWSVPKKGDERQSSTIVRKKKHSKEISRRSRKKRASTEIFFPRRILGVFGQDQSVLCLFLSA